MAGFAAPGGWGRRCSRAGRRGTALLPAPAAVRVASRASRGDPGRLWPPRDARDGGLPGGCPRDGRRSDSRHRHARENAHLPQTVRKDVGTPRSRPSSVSFRARKRGPGTRCVYLAPYRGVKARSAVVTVDQHAPKRGLPTLFLTGPDSRDAPVPPTSLSCAPSSTPRTPGRLGHGHSLPGPWTRRPVPSRAPASGSSSLPGRQLPEAPSLPGASLRGPVPPGRQHAGPDPFRGASFPRPIPPGRQLARPVPGLASRRGQPRVER
jgi:hypothetical protein